MADLFFPTVMRRRALRRHCSSFRPLQPWLWRAPPPSPFLPDWARSEFPLVCESEIAATNASFLGNFRNLGIITDRCEHSPQ